MLDKQAEAIRLRYKKPALALCQRDNIADILYGIASECGEVAWEIDDEETLINIFDGDSEEIYEFRMAHADLSANAERLENLLREEYITEYFDDFFAAGWEGTYQLVGYDSFQEDYYHLTRFESELSQSESGKRLMRLKKEEIISVAGQCVGIFKAFLDIQNEYEKLKIIFDMLRDDRAELIKSVTRAMEAYDNWQENPYNYAKEDILNNVLCAMPEAAWLY